MPDPPHDDPRHDPTLPLVQREVVLVVFLAIVGVILFFATRSLAHWSRETAADVAASWYERGQQLVAENKTTEGIAALRRAVAADRNTEYTLALVRTLIAVGSGDEARQLLVRLREEEPEQSEINYRLAGLAAARGENEDAIRYYNHALYGIAVAGQGVSRRQILSDLASLQIAQSDTAGAQATLAALTRETPSDSASQVGLAHLYAAAGDLRQALNRYGVALAENPRNLDALTGAADAAFSLGDFIQAQRYLEAAFASGATNEDLLRRRNLLQLVVSHDPLAAGLGMTERVRRLVAGLDWTARRLDVCREQSGQPAPDDLTAAVRAFRQQSRQDLRDTDVLAGGVALIARVETDVAARCGATDSLDQVWATIGRARGGAR